MCIVPILPGTTLILIAALLHKWILPGDLTAVTIGFIALFWFLSVLADLGGVLLGTRWFGGSKWGMAGASGGALVGLFFSHPDPDSRDDARSRRCGEVDGEKNQP